MSTLIILHRNGQFYAISLLILLKAVQLLIYLQNNLNLNPLIIDTALLNGLLIWTIFKAACKYLENLTIILLVLLIFYIPQSLLILKWDDLPLIILILVASGIFQILCFINMNRFRYAGNLSESQNDWVKYLSLFSIVETGLMFFRDNRIMAQLQFRETNFMILTSIVSILILLRIYLRNGIEPGSLKTSPSGESENRLNRTSLNAITYQSSKLKEPDLDFITSEIKNYMENSKIYLDPNITLKKLSQLTSIPKHHISQAINTQLQKNFYALISQYKISYAIRLIENDPEIKIEVLAQDCGFNSVSSFYRNFKQLKGLTPAEYARRVNSTGMDEKDLIKQFI
ncbi:MAG: AraC family transcriptional regulator [Sphingobacteriaceae bacterium]|nr:AraC family transcriptional regulator [Sphingobacteriaceae bacterium]